MRCSKNARIAAEKGAVGCVATTANFLPSCVADIYNSFAKGDLKEALEAQFRLTPIRNALDLASFPVGTKDLADLIGLDVGAPNLPNRSSNRDLPKKMKAVLRKEGVI